MTEEASAPLGLTDLMKRAIADYGPGDSNFVDLYVALTVGECREVLSAVESKGELRELLREYVHFSPAFYSKPMGAPGSEIRAGQEYHIALEERARAAIARATGVAP